MAFLTRTELLTSYADNDSEAITANTHRNFVESTMVYGALVSNGYTVEVNATPQRIEFDTEEYAWGMNAQAVGGLPNGGTYDSWANFQQGHYKIDISFDATLEENTYTFQLYGAADTPVGAGFEWPAKDAGARVLLNFMIAAHVTGDVSDLSLRVSANKNSDTIINNVTWVAHRLGSD